MEVFPPAPESFRTPIVRSRQAGPLDQSAVLAHDATAGEAIDLNAIDHHLRVLTPLNLTRCRQPPGTALQDVTGKISAAPENSRARTIPPVSS